MQARGQGEPQALQQTLLITFDRYLRPDLEGQGGRPRRTQIRYWMPECSRRFALLRGRRGPCSSADRESGTPQVLCIQAAKNVAIKHVILPLRGVSPGDRLFLGSPRSVRFAMANSPHTGARAGIASRAIHPTPFCQPPHTERQSPANLAALLSICSTMRAHAMHWRGRIARSRRTRLRDQRALHESSKDRRTIRNGRIVEVVAVVVHG